jgi:periplasmic copper chaperone A
MATEHAMRSTVIVLGTAFALFATAAFAKDYKVGALEIDNPWSRATPKGTRTAAGYVVIKNTGSTIDHLIGGALAGHASAQVHETVKDGGVMKMRAVAGGLEIKPGETVELKPGSFHLMFTDLKAPLVKGQTVKGTLSFENAGPVDVEFAIEGMGASAASDMDHMNADMNHMNNMKMEPMQRH